MELSVFVEIEKPLDDVWKAIVDFKNCSNYIESIIKLEIIEEPKDTFIGFKWKETRVMFGNKFYQTRAESHGSIYISRLSIENVGVKTKLTMSFTSIAQTFFVKVLSSCTGFMIKGSMKKTLIKDLNDIKTYLESK